MATVFAAHDRKHDRAVAVKVLHPDLANAVGARRFLREIEIVAGLQHPNIMPLLDSGSAGDLLYFIMPLVEGPSLFERLKQGPLPLGEALRLTEQVAGALAYAHRRFVVHLDIKPANILLSNGHAIITDFGIARAICDSCTDETGLHELIAGTPEYMSPEQATGSDALDGRSDVYSLACVLYEMLTGRRPFAAATAEGTVLQHWESTPPRVRDHRPAVPRAVEAALLHAMAKEPDERLPDASEFAVVLQGTRVVGTRSRPREMARRQRRVARRVAQLAAVAALLGAISSLAKPVWGHGEGKTEQVMQSASAALDEEATPVPLGPDEEAEKKNC